MRFGKWTVLERAENDKNRHAMWKCRCDCGVERIVNSTSLLNGTSLSCGCGGSKGRIGEYTTTHGESNTRLYKLYYHIRDRCYNPKQMRYKHYGGRGITMCPEWNTYEAFAEWAMDNGYRDDLSIERIDVDGNYCPENCTWIPLAEQSKNRRTSKSYKERKQNESEYQTVE